MISCGWSNPTPWHTPRECSEDELGKRIDALMARVRRPEALVMNFHVPPFQSGDYSEGILHGVLVTLDKGKLKGYQMVSG